MNKKCTINTINRPHLNLIDVNSSLNSLIQFIEISQPHVFDIFSATDTAAFRISVLSRICHHFLCFGVGCIISESTASIKFQIFTSTRTQYAALVCVETSIKQVYARKKMDRVNLP